jgi:hypothetical protein
MKKNVSKQLLIAFAIAASVFLIITIISASLYIMGLYSRDFNRTKNSTYYETLCRESDGAEIFIVNSDYNKRE